MNTPDPDRPSWIDYPNFSPNSHNLQKLIEYTLGLEQRVTVLKKALKDTNEILAQMGEIVGGGK